MATDWIKVEVNTPDKPEVIAITAKMGWDDADLTVGKLVRVWRWFDQHTVDGNAPSVTFALLDRLTGVVGFAKAMSEVGWLDQNEDGISLPNFGYHNGQTAKNRCQTAKRVAKHRSKDKSGDRSDAESNDGSNDVSVTETYTNALARKEKKRIERGTRLPSDWQPTPEMIAYCRETRPELDPNVVAENFRCYWVSKPTEATKLDWNLTWQTWVRKESAPRGKSFARTDDFLSPDGTESYMKRQSSEAE